MGAGKGTADGVDRFEGRAYAPGRATSTGKGLGARAVVARLVSAVLLLFLGLAAGVVTLHAAWPEPTGLVTDAANILDAGTEQQLAGTLGDAERRTSAQIAVVTVPSLDGLTIEDYAERLFRRWGIGQKGKDNGVLILVAPNDRQVRIEVGYGLEPILPDGLAGAIIREQALPAFRGGDFRGGIRATAARVASIVIANEVLSPEERERLSRANEPVWLMTGFLSLFVAVGTLGLGAGARARAVVPMFGGLLFTGMAMAIVAVSGDTTGLVVLALFGLAVLVFGWRMGVRESWREVLRGSSATRRGRSGWVMGGGSGGSRSGSSSFGGGSSGGGGASGRW